MVSAFRCAFVPLQAQAAQAAFTAQHAHLQGLIWAKTTTDGGFGPLADLPNGCTAFQLSNGNLTKHECSYFSIQQQKPDFTLPELLAQWQAGMHGQPVLPFCYVMSTSGSTGRPALVCGTEAGWIFACWPKPPQIAQQGHHHRHTL